MHKVSRERVYKECEGMIYNIDSRCAEGPPDLINESPAIRSVAKGCRPALSFGIMHRMGILDSVFPLSLLLAHYPPSPTSFSANNMDGLQQYLSQILNQKSIEIAFCLNFLLHLENSAPDVGEISASQLAAPVSGPFVKYAFYATMLVPFSHFKMIEKKKDVLLGMLLLRDGLKMENVSIKNILAIVDAVHAFRDIVGSKGFEQITIDEAGAILRQAREMWRVCLLITAAEHIANISTRSLVPTEGDWFRSVPITEDIKSIIDGFQRMMRCIENMGLEGVWDLKPLLDVSEPFYCNACCFEL